MIIRRYRTEDFSDVSDVCLRTAERGGDATGLYVSDDLMPDVFARPYLLFEPAFAFVLDDGQRVSGYILCAPDTASFVARYRAEWLPMLSRKYAPVTPPPKDRDELIRYLGLNPEYMLKPQVEQYPAHLHIDLLPGLQRRGWGRALMQTLVAALREQGVPGLHLGMDPDNVSARAFYERLGFQALPSSKPDAPHLGIDLR
jgi:ribosomal protein S18 acetylase RimI-like enzyme